MEFQIVLVLGLAVVVGLALGLLGGGGSILMVPLLTYVAGMAPKEAIAASLFIVGVTSLVSAFAHAREGNVRWRTGLVFGAAGMAGAFLGGVAGGYLPGAVLMIAFALMMVATAAAM
ncbi:MAG: sulfite exporter TauE/SafE family protein, partial [Nocardiopsis sp. BM-2018]